MTRLMLLTLTLAMPAVASAKHHNARTKPPTSSPRKAKSTQVAQAPAQQKPAAAPAAQAEDDEKPGSRVVK
jgi:cell division septum initiation protein DivIVA